MINTKEELMETVEKRVELLANGASNEELQSNDDRKQILSRSIESYQQNKKNKRVNYQNQKEIVIPDNLPALQFHPDTDKVKNKADF
ncbi:hypothetical protein [Absidia glauca]|uniref:TFIIS central domain-containing protein n=1 Tax=Absidia glauca TaxID=4829 RepID=A0A163J1P1_ABSGL|nr:hypothetical protein [Absidia glauca]